MMAEFCFDNTFWASEQDAKTYERVRTWLDIQSAVAIRQSAFLIAKLVLPYKDLERTSRHDEIEDKATFSATQNNSVDRETENLGGASLIEERGTIKLEVSLEEQGGSANPKKREKEESPKPKILTPKTEGKGNTSIQHTKDIKPSINVDTITTEILEQSYRAVVDFLEKNVISAEEKEVSEVQMDSVADVTSYCSRLIGIDIHNNKDCYDRITRFYHIVVLNTQPEDIDPNVTLPPPPNNFIVFLRKIIPYFMRESTRNETPSKEEILDDKEKRQIPELFQNELKVAETIARMKLNVKDVDLETQKRDAKNQIELSEWCISILSIKVAKPSHNLLLYLNGTQGWRDIILPMLNHVVLKLSKARNEEYKVERVVVSQETGEVLAEELIPCDKKLCIALVVLYYSSLEKLIDQEARRLERRAHPTLILNGCFHRALLACCYVCLLKAFGQSPELNVAYFHSQDDVLGVLATMDSTPYSFLKVTKAFSRAMKSNHSLPSIHIDTISWLPNLLQMHLMECETLVLDSFLWMCDQRSLAEGSVMDDLSRFRQASEDNNGIPLLITSFDNEIEEQEENGENLNLSEKLPSKSSRKYTLYILKRVLDLVESRISVLCKILPIPENMPLQFEALAAFRYVLGRQTKLLYGRHIDQVVLATLYGVCKVVMKAKKSEITFSRIIEAYSYTRDTRGKKMADSVVRRVRMEGRFGSVIEFYNELFVPCMKKYLLHSKTLKEAAAWVKANGSRSAGEPRTLKVNAFAAKLQTKISPNSQSQRLKFHIKHTGESSLKRKQKIGERKVFYKMGNAVRTDLDLANRMIKQYS